ncbi:hypothetical protein AA313_de0209505 [Arthrobotrys entomopaga]|nr:hypothetical protein AA313_de0209505 [Arthrobotrys entomopaga]
MKRNRKILENDPPGFEKQAAREEVHRHDQLLACVAKQIQKELREAKESRRNFDKLQKLVTGFQGRFNTNIGDPDAFSKESFRGDSEFHGKGPIESRLRIEEELRDMKIVIDDDHPKSKDLGPTGGSGRTDDDDDDDDDEDAYDGASSSERDGLSGEPGRGSGVGPSPPHAPQREPPRRSEKGSDHGKVPEVGDSSGIDDLSGGHGSSGIPGNMGSSGARTPGPTVAKVPSYDILPSIETNNELGTPTLSENTLIPPKEGAKTSTSITTSEVLKSSKPSGVSDNNHEPLSSSTTASSRAARSSHPSPFEISTLTPYQGNPSSPRLKSKVQLLGGHEETTSIDIDEDEAFRGKATDTPKDKGSISVGNKTGSHDASRNNIASSNKEKHNKSTIPRDITKAVDAQQHHVPETRDNELRDNLAGSTSNMTGSCGNFQASTPSPKKVRARDGDEDISPKTWRDLHPSAIAARAAAELARKDDRKHSPRGIKPQHPLPRRQPEESNLAKPEALGRPEFPVSRTISPSVDWPEADIESRETLQRYPGYLSERPPHPEAHLIPDNPSMRKNYFFPEQRKLYEEKQAEEKRRVEERKKSGEQPKARVRSSASEYLETDPGVQILLRNFMVQRVERERQASEAEAARAKLGKSVATDEKGASSSTPSSSPRPRGPSTSSDRRN